MRLTAMTDYALRLLMYVAARPQRLCTIAGIPPLPDGVVPLPGQRR